MPLTPEEQQELEELEELAELEQLEAEEAAKPKTGALQAGAEGLAQGVSLGFADEIEGAIRSAVGPKKYKEAVAEVRQRVAKARRDQPAASTIGELAGSFAVPVPGAGIFKAGKTALAGGKTFAKELGKAGARTAGVGAAQGVGVSDAESIGEAASAGARGAALGGVLAGIRAPSRAAARAFNEAPQFKQFLQKSLKEWEDKAAKFSVPEAIKKNLTEQAGIGLALEGRPRLPIRRATGAAVFRKVVPTYGIGALRKLEQIAANNPKKLGALKTAITQGRSDTAITQQLNKLLEQEESQ